MKNWPDLCYKSSTLQLFLSRLNKISKKQCQRNLLTQSHGSYFWDSRVAEDAESNFFGTGPHNLH
jgi:hypothetical protein